MKYILIISIMLTSLFSAPAYNALRIFKQANGDEFKARANGNHHLNWIEDENGEILKYNLKTKNYEYGVIDGINLKASGYKYKSQNNKKSKTRTNRVIKKVDKKDLNELWKKRKALRTKTNTHIH